MNNVLKQSLGSQVCYRDKRAFGQKRRATVWCGWNLASLPPGLRALCLASFGAPSRTELWHSMNFLWHSLPASWSVSSATRPAVAWLLLFCETSRGLRRYINPYPLPVSWLQYQSLDPIFQHEFLEAPSSLPRCCWVFSPNSCMCTIFLQHWLELVAVCLPMTTIGWLSS